MKYLSILIALFPVFTWSQNGASMTVNAYHTQDVIDNYKNYPGLNELLPDTCHVYITMVTKDCSADSIVADSIVFTVFSKNKHYSDKKTVTIVPDTATLFSSHIFAYGLLEGGEIVTKPKSGKKPLFIMGETSVIDSLHFLKQEVDKNGYVWFYVEFIYSGETETNEGLSIEKDKIQGWIRRKKTRYTWFYCNSE